MLVATGLVLAVVAWVVLFRLPREGLWTRTWVVAPLLIAYSTLALALDDRLGSTLGPVTPVEVGAGLAVGGAWLVATHVGHLVLCRLVPGFLAQVNDLYAIRDRSRPWSMVGAVVVMAVAEEMLFRGVVQGGTGLLVAVAAYTLVQAVEGKWALALAALLGGVVWGFLFWWRDGLVAPAVAHVLWTGALTFLWPLRGCAAPDPAEERAAAARRPAAPSPTAQEAM
ncbi:CPBP family intramembrane metalloprotease [Iamia sp. SCSIO 61187]|uniref:CPBP family glutamic-type intramembrane protease n=1 Tax=Iamia sp. SCSIO 61187 TaxID=2722752 RepID=UPI001C62630F|nr:CPBP family glutamic-type intramembrane protease [Iamia sp. SCSIO 61187]QYG92642.1 CPBP family intramembrane metalloprotease [Iamia sp. SCSIO 61187]